MLRLVGLLLLLLIGLGSVALWRGWVPPAYNPLRPLDVAAPLNPVTAWKLRLLHARPALCRAALRSLREEARPVPNSHPAPGCGLRDAVELSQGRSPIALQPPRFLASCPLAVDWALFTRHVLEPLALRDFGSQVTAIRHLGSYNCRDVREGSSRSAHATADAIDFAGLSLANGRSIAVTAWPKGGAEAAFLRQLRDGACRIFGVVLSPDFNADHSTHFHLQATGWGFCR